MFSCEVQRRSVIIGYQLLKLIPELTHH